MEGDEKKRDGEFLMNSQSRMLRGMSGGTLLFLYGPIVILILFSFNAAKIVVTWEGWSIHWYLQLISDDSVWTAAQNSLMVGLVSTVMVLILGLGAAMIFERRTFFGKSVIESAMLLPLVIPEIMMGVSLMLFFVMTGWPLGLSTIIIGHSVFNLPLVVIIIRARLRKIDPVLEEAARDLGATPWQAFFRVTLPLLRPGLYGAAVMAFTVSLDDFIVTFFTTGPGATTLPLKVFSMMRTGVSPEINALSALLVIISMSLIAVSLLLQRK